MDTRPKIEPPRVKRVLSVTFNEDKSCFAIGLEDGFMGESLLALYTNLYTRWLSKMLIVTYGAVVRTEDANIMLKKGAGNLDLF